MTLAADGPLLTTLARAKATLAATGQWSAISTVDKIHYDALPPPSSGADYSKADLIAARPFALLWHDTASGFRIDSDAAPGCPRTTGRIICQIEINTPEEFATDPSGLAEYVNRIAGRIVHTGDLASPGLFELAHQPGYLFVRTVEIDTYVRTGRKEANDLGDACVFDLIMHWGRV